MLLPAWLSLALSLALSLPRAIDAGLAPPPPPTPARAPVPPPLTCLARFYALRPERRGDQWFAILPDGVAVPYDDGKTKTFDQRLAAPDVEDMFSIPYPTGSIQPVTRENDDPGRIRVDPIFTATYGARREKVEVVKIHFLEQDLTVNRRVAPAFQRVAARLATALAADPSLGPFLRGLGGTFVWRNIAGTDRPSAHSYGVSVDINVKRSHYWRWQKPPQPLRWRNEIPAAIVRAFEAEGFIWGGRWYHYDTMHFEYRPELLDPACYPAALPAGRP